MNKSQEFDIMQMRAKLQVDKIIEQHQVTMYGKDPIILGEPKSNAKNIDQPQIVNDGEE